MLRLEKDGAFEELWLVEGPPPRQTVFVQRGTIGQNERLAPKKERMAFEEPFAGEREYCDLVVARLRVGWVPVSFDPSLDVAQSFEPRDPELDASLLADRDDEGASLVYADWLQQRTHPRGALIAVQHARETRSDDPVLAAEEARLLSEHPIELMLALADAIPSDDGVGVFLEWRRGFIRKARIDGIRDRYASESRLLQLLRCPAARFLSELEIGVQTDGNNALM